MPLLNIVIALIVVGVGLWLINRFIPMASSIKTILNVVVVVAVGIWVLQATGAPPRPRRPDTGAARRARGRSRTARRRTPR